jgi:hypothetical protein
MKIGTKNYQIKVYDNDYNIETIIADARIQYYKDKINSGPGEFIFDVERTLNDWTTLGNLALNKIIELWVNDNDTSDYIKVYSGYISRISFLESSNKRKVTVTSLGFVSRLGWDIYKNGTTTTISEATTEPATIFKNIIDKLRDTANGNIPFLNYTPTSIQDTNLSVSVKFESDTYLDALNKVLSMSPANWFWRLDQDNVFNLSQRAEVADHNFSMGHIESLQIDYSMEDVVNGVLIWDNDVVYRYISRTDSQSLYGRRIKKENMPSADGTDAMDKKAQSIVGEQSNPRSSIVIVVADNNEFEAYGDLAGYDIESIKPGQTCQVTGIDEVSGAFLSKSMLIRNVTYYPTSAILEVDIDRKGIDDLLVNFKKETDQVEKDGIPTSYTAV